MDTILPALALLASIAWSGLGLSRILRAGAIERRGGSEEPRALARGGGRMMAAAALAQPLCAAWLVHGLPAAALQTGSVGSAPRVLWMLAAIVAGLAAGFVGLLAGLSGKPRPSGGFAAALLAASAGAWALALYG